MVHGIEAWFDRILTFFRTLVRPTLLRSSMPCFLISCLFGTCGAPVGAPDGSIFSQFIFCKHCASTNGCSEKVLTDINASSPSREMVEAHFHILNFWFLASSAEWPVLFLGDSSDFCS